MPHVFIIFFTQINSVLLDFKFSFFIVIHLKTKLFSTVKFTVANKAQCNIFDIVTVKNSGQYFTLN